MRVCAGTGLGAEGVESGAWMDDWTGAGSGIALQARPAAKSLTAGAPRPRPPVLTNAHRCGPFLPSWTSWTHSLFPVLPPDHSLLLSTVLNNDLLACTTDCTPKLLDEYLTGVFREIYIAPPYIRYLAPRDEYGMKS